MSQGRLEPTVQGRTMFNKMTRCNFLLAVAGALAMSVQVLADTPRNVNVQAGDLVQALDVLAKQCGVDVVYPSKQLRGMTTKGVTGTLETREAFERLIEGTRLVLREDGKSVMISLPKGEARREKEEEGIRLAQGDTSAPPQTPQESRGELEELEEIVVTGTHIRGTENNTAPVTVLDRAYIDSAGISTTTALIESLPQNFALASQSGVLVPGVTSPEVQGSAINLRAIGEGTTLTLLNGRRMASGFFGRAPDISALPLSAIDRVEVLTDGASAVYGSDAVGGVVNFILRRDFKGAETQLRSGWADGVNEYRVSQALGNAWDSGNALLSVEYYKRDLLEAEDRNFVPPASLIGSLYPRDENYSALFSGRQSLTDKLSAFADALYTHRDTYNEGGRAIFDFNAATENPQLTATTGLTYKIVDWQIEGSASYARNETDLISRSSEPDVVPTLNFEGLFTIESAQLKADGSLFDLPGGSARAAIGADWRSEHYRFANSNGFGGDFDRIVRSVFGEIYAPLIGPDNAKAGVRRLELSLAGRFDDYSSFGSSFDPRLGLMWEPVAGLRLRGSFGTSYVAPSLSDYDVSFNGATAFPFADPGSPSGTSYILLTDGSGDEGLSAQESESWSLGLEFSPPAVPGLHMGFNYYRIDYTDRIAAPPSFIVVLDNPQSFGKLIARDPTREQIEAAIESGRKGLGFAAFDPNDPNFLPISEDEFFEDAVDAVDVVIDARRQNLSVVKTDGLDVSLEYAFRAAGGEMQLGLNGTYIFELEQQLTAASEPFKTVDTFNNPPDWRVRASLGWQRQAWATSLFLSHADSYTDNRIVAAPVPVGSYTTVDARVAYDFKERVQSGFLAGLTLSACAQNLFDRVPPRTAVIFDFRDLGFDPTNANPMGRLLAIDLVKSW
jgi:iron complex outermembrane recepter protein